MIITLWGIMVYFVGQNGDFGFSLLAPLQDCLHCSCFLALKSDNHSNIVSLDKNVLRALFRTHFNPCLWVKVVLSGAQNILYPQTLSFDLTITHQQMNIHVNCSCFLSLKKEKICMKLMWCLC